jgi:hypothetical protein
MDEMKRVICLLPYTDNHLPEIFSGICSLILVPVFWSSSFVECARWIVFPIALSGFVTIAGSLTSHHLTRRAGAILTLIFSITLLISCINRGSGSDVAAVMLSLIALWNYFRSGFEKSIRSMTK